MCNPVSPGSRCATTRSGAWKTTPGSVPSWRRRSTARAAWAVRDGDRQIDTAHLLHSLLENDPEVRAAFGGGPQLARLFGYLVQRSIGYGLRWQGGVEDSGAVPVVTTVEGFSPLASTALRQARVRAAARPGPHTPDAGRAAYGDSARGVDLLAAVLADPQTRAVEVLGRAASTPSSCARGSRTASPDTPRRTTRPDRCGPAPPVQPLRQVSTGVTVMSSPVIMCRCVRL